MTCVMCPNKRPLKMKMIKMKYKQSGLDYITLRGVQYFKCNKCGEEYYGFGDQEKLNARIADTLITKEKLLNGKEIRFLRTYLGYSSSMFAQLIGYSRETIYRLEGEKQKIKKNFDRLVRSLVTNKLPDRNYEIHDQWLNEEGKSYSRIELKAYKDDWQVSTAA